MAGLDPAIRTEAIQLFKAVWIASSLALLAMTNHPAIDALRWAPLRAAS
jgi:hypothetical protein